MSKAVDHVREAYWAARAADRTAAASHLLQALWPPKVYAEAYKLPVILQTAAATAYAELLDRRRLHAVETLRRAIYPCGVPKSEFAKRRNRCPSVVR